MKKIPWQTVYKQLANSLCTFYEKNNKNRCGIILFKKIDNRDSKSTYLKKLIKLFPEINKFKDNFNIHSIDPIHIFSSINRSNIQYKTRIELIKLYFHILTVKWELNETNEEIDFSGIPEPIIDRIAGARDYYIQGEIWDFFYFSYKEKALNNYDFISKYDIFTKVQNWRGIKNVALTIFMYWIRSDKYLPLDNKTLVFLKKNKFIFKDINSTQNYIELLESFQSSKQKNIFYELVNKAYSPYMDYMKNNIQNKNYQKNNIQKYKDTEPITSQNLHFIAIKPLKDCNKNYLKTLKADEVYYFNNLYTISDNKISYKYKDNYNMYNIYLDNLTTLNINISSIVGKNGTGKSTIVELLTIIINEISRKINKELDISEVEKNINVELYVFIDKMYLFKLENNNMEIYSYYEIMNNKSDKREYLLSKDKIDDFKLNNFFYSILLNYSLHGLNEKDHKNPWLSKLFHKNDAYQTPIVIEPHRKNGNIKINKQINLVKSRLLSNLLVKCNNKDDLKTYRKLTEYQYADRVKISINKSKFEYLLEIGYTRVLFNPNHEDYISNTLSNLFSIFNIENLDSSVNINNMFSTLENITKIYIFKKIVTILNRYNHYNFPFTYDTEIDKLFYEKLYDDKSHITYKIRQAINFLKHYNSISTYKALKKNINFNKNNEVMLSKNFIKLDYLSDNIHDIMITDNVEDSEIINYTIPSFFDVEIFMNDSNSFNQLSSGEKQKIYTINSVLYHLNNINSVNMSDNMIKYKSVNIILDEIELYFHPELQREFLNDILERIEVMAKKQLLDSLYSINFIFITHSPFIISDIPSINLMLLEKKESQNKTTYSNIDDLKTFGANIHDLLADGFFLEKGTIGKFAINKIQQIIQFHKDFFDDKKDSYDYKQNKDEFHFIKNSIGEDYIAGIIENYIIEIENKIYSKSSKEEELKILEQKVQQLKKDLNND